MKQQFYLFFIAIAFLSSTPAQSEIEPGFVSLFNGKNLDGWVIENGPDNSFEVEKGTIHSTVKSGYPTWLRSEKEYENFDLRFDFQLKGWSNTGIFFCAPKHGRNSLAGFEYQIMHPQGKITTNTCGAIFGAVPPSSEEIKGPGNWNSGRIVLDWPRLEMYVNEVQVQNIDLNEHGELKYRLRKGYLGIQDVDYNAWFKNIRIKELPSKYQERWITLFNGENFEGWYQEGTGAKWFVRDGILRSEDNGSYMVSEGEFEDFELHAYIRTDHNTNGGIFFRWNELKGGDRGNEIQIENVPDSPHPTGSLYNVVIAKQPYYQVGEWFLMQIRIEGSHCVVRVNGETTVDFNELKIIRPGHISLQMHHNGKWIEWKDIKILPLN